MWFAFLQSKDADIPFYDNAVGDEKHDEVDCDVAAALEVTLAMFFMARLLLSRCM